MQWFVNTGDSFETVDTKEAAQAAALKAIDDWRGCCDPDWPEEVREVCFGPIFGHAAEIDVEADPDSFYADYVLDEVPTTKVQHDLGFQVPYDGETKFILGTVCFVAAKYAHFLRATGYEVPSKAELEQAAALHWMLNLYLLHGSDWRRVADEQVVAWMKGKTKCDGQQDATTASGSSESA